MSECVVLAGGGTGGHVFPLVAVADALVRLRPGLTPIFVGTERGMETRFVPERGYRLELLSVLPIRGGGARGVVRGVARAAALLPESRALLRRLEPAAVFSVGGYAAGPVSLAARTLGLPLALLEPNSVIGLANWLLSPVVDRAYTAFEITDRRFAPAVVRRLGVPLRGGFVPRPQPAGRGPLRVLVLGGSQGAKALNEIVPQALARLKSPVQIVHQAGAAHIDDVRGRYEALGLAARVTPFIDDMPAELAAAELVLSRSGASAVSEILAVGRPSLLFPYPFASGDHQRINAEAVERAGAGRSLPHEILGVERLAAELTLLIDDRSVLSRMAEAARGMGQPDAATRVAEDFLDLAFGAAG
ncbi:MAG TPA: undecaprenyldiphospho-muramoylpentapeptide beta-N-acetylglucosaminyltransferase [Polyangiaceae bacterium]|nr:undecaprenyldiphospho-muramoylpentapeptide beta-N-acetylglucosaminyltransferase [Polyangiaceae bacterium]